MTLSHKFGTAILVSVLVSCDSNSSPAPTETDANFDESRQPRTRFRLVSTAFPRHRVLEAQFLEDFNPTPGVAHYDLITVFDLTLGTQGQWQPERGGDHDDDDDDDD